MRARRISIATCEPDAVPKHDFVSDHVRLLGGVRYGCGIILAPVGQSEAAYRTLGGTGPRDSPNAARTATILDCLCDREHPHAEQT